MDNFPKGLTHGFGPKMAIFPRVFFRQYRPGKRLFGDSRKKKRLSRLKKTRSSNNRKIHIFPKRLTHGFGPKMAIFQSVFLRQYRPEKCLLGDSRKTKRLSRL